MGVATQFGQRPPGTREAGLRETGPRRVAQRQTLVRGQALKSLLGALGAELGARELAEVFARLHTLTDDDAGSSTSKDTSSSARLLLSRSFGGTSWYPLAHYAAIHRLAREVTGRGPELARALGREARRIDGRGLYRFVLRFSTPELYLKHLVRVLALYVEGPRLEIGSVHHATVGDSELEFRFDHANGFDENIWEDALGGTQALLEMSNARDVRVAMREGGGAETWCVAEARWKR